jgi:hypothetical protein
MASAEAKEEAPVYTKGASKADGYVDPFDGCIPRKVNAKRAKEILVRSAYFVTQILSTYEYPSGWPIQSIHAPALLSKVQKDS